MGGGVTRHMLPHLSGVPLKQAFTLGLPTGECAIVTKLDLKL